MAEMSSREKELVLAPNEFAFIQDKTKGNIVVYVGPNKASLSATDSPVTFDYKTKSFDECNLDTAIQRFATAPEGWYHILKNPAAENKHPSAKMSNDLMELQVGRKINIPGPASFPLWPGQMIKTIKGHHLRSNQYLVVRIYDDKAAKDNWKHGVIKTRGENDEQPIVEAIKDFSIGQLIVIKGTEVSFYIPPSGVEVVPEKDSNNQDVYVRNAVTLETLEYCVLLDENGTKRFVEGPAVVFPEPTEVFLTKDINRKFKAIELNENSGIYVKVISEYTEDIDEKDPQATPVTRKVGEELFITGKEQMIYFPRSEHALIKYGDEKLHYAIAIPEGEARYVLDRETGEVVMVKGPRMFLPDPRKEVIVRRVLTPQQVELWFPGNKEALDYNRKLNELAQYSPDGKIGEYVSDSMLKKSLTSVLSTANSRNADFVGDGFDRKNTFTPPRTITLDTKYDGAVYINVWTGYAVQVVSKTGERKVIVGPQTYLLEYDEILESMELSTGKPKTTDKLLKTVYLRVKNNKVSDIIPAETKDYCGVNIKVSYCVNFEGESQNWFNVENYVKFLCDHMRSMTRNKTKQYGIEEFYKDSVNIVRDAILGPKEARGYICQDNGMKIYDVEVLDVKIQDNEINYMLVETQQNIINQMLKLAQRRKELELTREEQEIEQTIAELKSVTLKKKCDLEKNNHDAQLIAEKAKLDKDIALETKRYQANVDKQEQLNAIKNAEISREKASLDLKLQDDTAYKELRLKELEAEVEAVVNKSKAISPQLIAALQSIGDKHLIETLCKEMSPLAMLGGTSVADVLNNLLKGTNMENNFRGLLNVSLDKDSKK